ncbi:hypothetical protein PQR71_42290 [Paraburkholderia fungorum]|uniref:hypothetical protein n=1 Tax=Paraburkholderia fungorum TaxID=134537 RepID=UPI0038B7EEA7
MSNECPRAGKLFGGCKFEARFDRIPPEQRKDIFAPYQMIEEINARTKRIYVHDVCVRCGKTVKR